MCKRHVGLTQKSVRNLGGPGDTGYIPWTGGEASTVHRSWVRPAGQAGFHELGRTDVPRAPHFMDWGSSASNSTSAHKSPPVYAGRDNHGITRHGSAPIHRLGELPAYIPSPYLVTPSPLPDFAVGHYQRFLHSYIMDWGRCPASCSDTRDLTSTSRLTPCAHGLASPISRLLLTPHATRHPPSVHTPRPHPSPSPYNTPHS